MATTNVQSFLDQLLDKFECWMIQAEFGSAIAQLPASSQTSLQALDE
ncbi:hypothetical protein [Rheinheimera sp. SA_1]|nr:hypothetical protein [Rheinheimera sp. SA_1]